MSQEQDIKYIAPQTKQAMIEYATEELMSLLRELPGGNSLSDKKIEELSDKCAGELGESKTFEEMQERVNKYLNAIQTIAENADVSKAHWKETEARLDEVKAQFDEKFNGVIELIEQTNARVEVSMQEAAERIESIMNGGQTYSDHEVNPFGEPELAPEIMEALANAPIVDLDDKSPFDFADTPQVQEETMDSIAQNNSVQIPDIETMENIAPHEVEEPNEPQIIERDGKKYVITKDAEYDEAGQLVAQGELRTLGACNPEEMQKGQVVINNGTFNMILTLDEYKEMVLAMDHLQSKPQNRKLEEMDK